MVDRTCGRWFVGMFVVVGLGVAAEPAAAGPDPKKPGTSAPAELPRPKITPLAATAEPMKAEAQTMCRDGRPTLQAFKPRPSRLILEIAEKAIEYAKVRSEWVRPGEDGAFARFTSSRGRVDRHYEFSTMDPGNPVLKIDTKAGNKYAVHCETSIDVPPVVTYGGCTHQYTCKERVRHRLPFYVNCEGPWAGTAPDQTALAGDPYGGWAFIRKWGVPGEVDRLAGEGWVLEPCQTQPMQCVPDKNKVFYEVCPRTHDMANSPKHLFERCDISQSPVAMLWEIRAASQGSVFEKIASGLVLASDPRDSAEPAAAFVAVATSTTTLTIDYPLNNIITAGYRNSLVVKQIDSDAPGACRSVDGVVRERVYEAVLKPVSWSLWSCEVAEFAPHAKP